MSRKSVLTDVQRKALDEADAGLTRFFDEANAKLSAAGLGRQGADGDARCLRCDCDGYLQGHGLKCKRPGCGHSFTSHDVR
jgi:hypothetical protein